jgi:hypothetical protein
MEKHFDPEKYGMLFCPVCNGDGKLLIDRDSFDVCMKCGGFGLIRKEMQGFKRNGRNPWIRKDHDVLYRD